MVKKFLLFTLIILSFPFITKAQTGSVDINLDDLSTNTNVVIYNDPYRENKIFNNWGRGTLITMILVYREGQNINQMEMPTIYSVNARTDSGYSTCKVSSVSNVFGNDLYQSAVLYGIECDLEMGENGLISLSANFAPSTQYMFYKRVYRITFNTVASDNSQVLNQMYSYMQQDILPEIQNSNQATENINNTLNDESSVSNNDLEDTLDDWNDNLTDENALSDFILMPFTILNNISTGLGSRCETFNLGSLLGHNIVLPCIDIEDYLGNNLWGTIDSLFCLFMIYNIAMLFIQCFEGITTLRDDFDSLYTPQHGDFGYRPKHGSD